MGSYVDWSRNFTLSNQLGDTLIAQILNEREAAFLLTKVGSLTTQVMTLSCSTQDRFDELIYTMIARGGEPFLTTQEMLDLNVEEQNELISKRMALKILQLKLKARLAKDAVNELFDGENQSSD